MRFCSPLASSWAATAGNSGARSVFSVAVITDSAVTPGRTLSSAAAMPSATTSAVSASFGGGVPRNTVRAIGTW